MNQQRAVEDVLKSVDEMQKEPTRYHLVLVVGQDESGISSVLHEAALRRNCPILDMGSRLSEALVAVPEQRRALKAGQTVRHLVADVAGTSAVVAVDNMDILFDPALSLNPLALLSDISRTVTLIAAWQGHCTWSDNSVLMSLDHANPGHDEYYACSHADEAAIVDLERAEER